MSKTTSQPTQVPLLDGVHPWFREFQVTGPSERVQIQNMGTCAQPLTGWVLTSLHGPAFYAFPDGLILEPGQSVCVASGPEAEPPLPGHLLWTNEAMWNNKHDTAVLFDAAGNEVIRIAHGSEHTQDQRPKRLERAAGGLRLVNLPPTGLNHARGKHHD